MVAGRTGQNVSQNTRQDTGKFIKLNIRFKFTY